MSQSTSTVQLVDFWTNRIQSDLAPFSDPGGEVTLVKQGRTISASWSQRGKEREAKFSVSHDGVRVQSSQREYAYRAFFASPEMADLPSLARMIVKARPAQLYIETKARVEGGAHGPKIAGALECIRDALRGQQAEEATQIVMITGDAGAGKTSVLQELVRTQADGFVRGKADCVYLYVNAQGRALARFTEAVAAELDELRSSLTFHEVTPLVRLGLLVPVIDGFDELLGVGGYDEAFSSLSAFVEELDGDGQLITSARSAYYEQEFVSRSASASSLGAPIWKQTSVQVLDWTSEESAAYVRGKCAEKQLTDAETTSALDKVEAAFVGENSALLTKPLFVSKTLDLVLKGERLDLEQGLLRSMVSIYLERERTEKLLDRSGRSLLSAKQIESLLIEVSEEMWNLETRELDTRSVKSIAEYVVESYGVGAGSQTIVERMSSMAFLSKGSRHNSVTFEHETFFAYFLASRFAERICLSDVPLNVLLGRSALSEDIASMTAQRLGVVENSSGPGVQSVIARLGNAGALQSPRQTQVRENSGRIAQSLLKLVCRGQRSLSDLVICRLIFPGGDFDSVTLDRPRFQDVEFRRVDLTRTSFLTGSAEGTSFFDVIVDRSVTRLELTGIDYRSNVLGLRVVGADSAKSEFDPIIVRAVLVDVGMLMSAAPAPRTRSVRTEIVSLLERFVRAYNRANPLCVADDTLRAIFLDSNWAELQRCLVESQAVSAESKNTSGRPKTFLRRTVTQQQILAGMDPDADVPNSVQRLWSLLEERFHS